MGLKEFKIEYDKPFASYMPGEIVTGKVILNVDSTKIIKALKVTIKGFASVYWTESVSSTDSDGKSTTSSISHTNHEDYLNTQFYLLKSTSGEKIELTAGTYIYPFSFNLITNLPSSFEGTSGHVRYTVKATLDRPWRFNQDTKAAFTVISHLDLNTLSYASTPIMLEQNKTFCCLCCVTPNLSINLSLPVRGYVPGQIIPVKIDVDNKSRIAISKIKVVLQKKVAYIATKDTDRSTVIVKKVSRGPIGGNETTSYVEKLEVPPLPPSFLQNCKIIELEYEIKVEACIPDHRNLVLTAPIIIGTIPLLNYQMPCVSGQEIYSPSAPSVEALQTYPSPTSSLYPDISPPSYGESMFGSKDIRDSGEDRNVIGAGLGFAPRYLVYNFNN